mgnify:CR=1 FL=1
MNGGTFIWEIDKYKGLNNSGKYDSIWMNYLDNIVDLDKPKNLDNNKPRLWSKWLNGNVSFPFNKSINKSINLLNKNQLILLNKKIGDSIKQREKDLQIGKKYDRHKYVLDNLKYIFLYNKTKLQNKMDYTPWKKTKKTKRHKKYKRKSRRNYQKGGKLIDINLIRNFYNSIDNLIKDESSIEYIDYNTFNEKLRGPPNIMEDELHNIKNKMIELNNIYRIQINNDIDQINKSDNDTFNDIYNQIIANKEKIVKLINDINKSRLYSKDHNNITGDNIDKYIKKLENLYNEKIKYERLLTRYKTNLAEAERQKQEQEIAEEFKRAEEQKRLEAEELKRTEEQKRLEVEELKRAEIEKAVTKIQTAVKDRQTKKKNTLATKIQSMFRGNIIRNELEKAKTEKLEKKRQQAEEDIKTKAGEVIYKFYKAKLKKNSISDYVETQSNNSDLRGYLQRLYSDPNELEEALNRVSSIGSNDNELEKRLEALRTDSYEIPESGSENKDSDIIDFIESIIKNVINSIEMDEQKLLVNVDLDKDNKPTESTDDKYTESTDDKYTESTDDKYTVDKSTDNKSICKPFGKIKNKLNTKINIYGSLVSKNKLKRKVDDATGIRGGKKRKSKNKYKKRGRKTKKNIRKNRKSKKSKRKNKKRTRKN